MKHILLTSFLSFFILFAFGQNKFLGEKPKNIQKQDLNIELQSIRGVSPSTAFLILDLNRADSIKLTEEQLIEKYALIIKDNIIYANSFITIDQNSNIEALNKYGILINSKNKNTFTGLIPINILETLTNSSEIIYIQIGEKAEPLMNAARTRTNVNQVHLGTSLTQPYFGEGVVVGIIDGGFDYTHPNFYNSTGSNGYRVKKVWEQNATSGVPPVGYTYGRELTTQSAILTAQRDMQNFSHGTHVAGIAAGAGGGASTTYTGVAPKADLVFVSTTLTDPGILDGIQYIQDYAISVGKPSVINISLGNHIGPHDGTSLFDQMTENLVGNGKIIVGSAGNAGGLNLHLEKSYSITDTSLFTFIEFTNSTLGTNGSTYLDIWGEVGKNFHVGVHIYNTNTNTFEDWTPYLYSAAHTNSYSHTLYDDDTWFPDPCYVQISTGIDPNNNKPRATIYLDHTEQDDNYRFVMIEIIAKSTKTKMWANNAVFTHNFYNPPVLAGNSNYSVGEIGGTGKGMISVGAYTSKNSWTSFYSSTEYAPFYSAIGAIAEFSSKGPTADLRTKPDITAPGNILASSLSRFDASYPPSSSRVVSSITNSINDWTFGMMEGTSMAAPMVTGIIALWLEMYPDLNPTQVKNIFKSTSITDNHTGSIPYAGSNIWGWGKINAWIELPIPPQPNISPINSSICSGSTVTLTAPSGYSAYQWNTGATTQSISVNTSGTYKVKVENSSGFKSSWSNNALVTINPNPPTPTITQKGDTLISSSSTGNQWYKNNAIINGATGQKHIVTSSGSYKVKVTNTHGCSKESLEVNTFPISISDLQKHSGLSLFPNPTNRYLNLKFEEDHKYLSYTIYNILGKPVISKQLNNVKANEPIIIDLSTLINGVYNFKLFNNNMNLNIQITKIH